MRGLSGSSDNTVRLWDLERGECVKVLEGHTNWVRSVALTADGKKGLSGSLDNTVRMWDLERGACVKVLEGHTRFCGSVALTADGVKGLSGSKDKWVRIWDLASAKSAIPIANQQSQQFNCTGLVLDDCRGLSPASLSILIEQGAQGVAHPELLPPFTDLVPAQESLLKTLTALRTYSSQEESLVPQLTVEIRHRFLHYLWDIVLSSRDVPILGVDSGQAITLLNWAGISMNADSLVKMGIDNLKGVHIPEADLSHADLSSVDMSDANCRGVKCWYTNLQGVNWRGADLKGLKVVQSCLTGHTDAVMSVGLTADGSKGLSGSGDKTVRLWDLERGECVKVLEGHTRLCEECRADGGWHEGALGESG